MNGRHRNFDITFKEEAVRLSREVGITTSPLHFIVACPNKFNAYADKIMEVLNEYGELA